VSEEEGCGGGGEGGVGEVEQIGTIMNSHFISHFIILRSHISSSPLSVLPPPGQSANDSEGDRGLMEIFMTPLPLKQ
jgi:hypothetical protein